MSKVRLPENLNLSLRNIQQKLKAEYGKDAPSIQDISIVALKRFLQDFTGEEETKIINQLLESRKQARSKMGNK